MASFRQWESDPLFSAAEVVQDSADRMDSIFRLLLHEQYLIRANNSDEKLLKSIEYYRRDLATAVETAKWQLEDFEREVNLSATMDKSHTKANVISRHKQFINAIREQVLDVENTLRATSAGDLVKGDDRVTLHEQDTNGLSLFLSGDYIIKDIPIDDNNSMIRFLDPTSSSNLDSEIVEHNHEENLYSDKNIEFKENTLRKVGSHFSMHRNFEASSSLQEIAYETNNEGGCWDLESNGAASRSFFDDSNSRGYNKKRRIFGSLPTLCFMYGSRARRSFAKRWKDGEEQMSSRYPALQGNCRILNMSSMYICFQAIYLELFTRLEQSSRWISQSSMRFRRSTYYSQAKGYSMLLIPALILTLIVLGILLL